MSDDALRTLDDPVDGHDLDRLVGFLDAFERPGFVFVSWPDPPPGVMGWADYSDAARAFIEAAHESGFVCRDFDWPSWKEREGRRLYEHPRAIEEANLPALRRFVTALVRQDRFCEGALGAAFTDGVLTRILRRLRVLRPAT
jgi:hypothetical protein